MEALKEENRDLKSQLAAMRADLTAMRKMLATALGTDEDAATSASSGEPAPCRRRGKGPGTSAKIGTSGVSGELANGGGTLPLEKSGSSPGDPPHQKRPAAKSTKSEISEPGWAIATKNRKKKTIAAPDSIPGDKEIDLEVKKFRFSLDIENFPELVFGFRFPLD